LASAASARPGRRFSDASDFDLRRQIAEPKLVTGSQSAAKTLTDNYVGLPLG